VFVAAQTASGVAATSAAVPWASTTAGDWCLLALVISGLSAVTDPPGWTVLDSWDTSTTLRVKTWWRRCDGTESGTQSVTWAAAQNAAAAMVAYRYLAAIPPVYGHAITGTTATTNNWNTQALTSMTRVAEDINIWVTVQSVAPATLATAAVFARAAVSAPSAPYVTMLIGDPGPAGPQGGSTQAYPARNATLSQSGTSYAVSHVAALTAVNSLTEDNFVTAAWAPADPAPAPRVVDVLTGTSKAVPPALGQIWPRG